MLGRELLITHSYNLVLTAEGFDKLWLWFLEMAKTSFLAWDTLSWLLSLNFSSGMREQSALKTATDIFGVG